MYQIGRFMVEDLFKFVKSRAPKTGAMPRDPFEEENNEVLSAYRSIANPRIRQSVRALIIMIASEEHLAESA